jgi:hypothetical protein
MNTLPSVVGNELIPATNDMSQGGRAIEKYAQAYIARDPAVAKDLEPIVHVVSENERALADIRRRYAKALRPNGC